MLNRDLDEFVQCELFRLGAAAHDLYPEPVLPQRLFYPCDAGQLDAVVRSGAMPAVHWRLGVGGPLVGYGVELARSFLQAACSAPGDRLRRRFREHLLAHFDPRGTHFDGFVAELLTRVN